MLNSIFNHSLSKILLRFTVPTLVLYCTLYCTRYLLVFIDQHYRSWSIPWFSPRPDPGPSDPICGCMRLHTSATTLLIIPSDLLIILSRLSFPFLLYSNTRLYCWWIHRRLRAYLFSLKHNECATCSIITPDPMSVELVQLYTSYLLLY